MNFVRIWHLDINIKTNRNEESVRQFQDVSLINLRVRISLLVMDYSRIKKQRTTHKMKDPFILSQNFVNFTETTRNCVLMLPRKRFSQQPNLIYTFEVKNTFLFSSLAFCTLSNFDCFVPNSFKHSQFCQFVIGMGFVSSLTNFPYSTPGFLSEYVAMQL